MFYSSKPTCRANDVEPYGYLPDVLDMLPHRPAGADVTDLLQFNQDNSLNHHNGKSALTL